MEPFYAYRSFWQEKPTISRFAEFGVNTVCIFPAHTMCSLGLPYSKYPPTWIGPNCYDFNSLSQQIQDVIDANSQAKLICLIDLNCPAWWPRQYSNRNAHDSFYHLGQVSSDQAWRDDTTAYLKAFIQHVQENFPNNIAGYILGAGGTIEWLDYTFGQESISRTKAWRKWMTDQGKPDPLDIPSQSVRSNITHDFLRDPQNDALAIDYWRFVNQSSGKTILHFAAAAQEILSHQVPIGVFYGYILELAQDRFLSESHLDYENVFASDDLDFFIAPGTYCDRGLGQAGGIMSSLGTIQRHGKQYLHEIDHRTHTAFLEPGKENNMLPLWDMAQFKNAQESIAGLQREFAFCLTQKTSLWWFDMFGKWYDDPKVEQAMQQMAQLWSQYRNIPDQSATQVAIIADPNSALYLDQSDPRISVYFNLRAQLGRIGAPYTIFSVSDIPHIDWSNYKLIIFPALYVTDGNLQHTLQQHLLNSNRTIIWGDRPGVINNDKYDLANVQNLTGCQFDHQNITTCNHTNWNSVLAPSAAITHQMLRNHAQQAGVHLYTDQPEPVFASQHFLAVHTAVGGKRKFSLPHKVNLVHELLSDRVVAKDVSEFEDQLDAPSTVLYYLM